MLALVLLSPILCIVAVAIRLDSPGPAIYRARRTGLLGVEFEMLKFRTMFVNATSQSKGFTTGLNDPRVTRVGKWLRRFKVDELPQLINVVAGEMSLVGPRPEMPYYTAQYTEAERAILSVRPGITDYSSIYFHNLHEIVGSDDPDTAFEEKVLPLKKQLRLKYVQQHSFLVDLSIIGQTIWVLLKRGVAHHRRAD
jgi:lipopolysaccharide/colanic/teichoic acid biosynthesis glycosyltransferase